MGFFKRTFVLYLIVFTAGYFLLNHQPALEMAKLKVLSRLMPALRHLLDVQEGKVQADQNQFRYYLLYFQSLREYVPELKETYGWLAYCYNEMDRPEEAVRYFEEMRNEFSSFFWVHYNLGIIHLKNSQFAPAAESFEAALNSNLEATIKLTKLSLVYSHIVNASGFTLEELALRLQSSYRDAAKLLEISQYYQRVQQETGNPVETDKLNQLDVIHLRMF